MVKAGVVPKVLAPLQSNATTPDPPVTTDETFGVKLEQWLVMAVLAGIDGNVWVKRVVAA
jgi:hypothetical protein